MNIEEKTDLISPNTYNEKENRSLEFMSTIFGYTRCISGKMIQLYKFFTGDKNIHSIGACMIFRSSFRIDDRYPHGMEDVEFSKRIKQTQSIVNTKIVSNVSVLHKGQKHQNVIPMTMKKIFTGKGFAFENRQTRLIIGSLLSCDFQRR